VTYDVAVGWRRVGEEYFSQTLTGFCADLGLSLFFVEPVWVREFTAKLRQGKIGVRVLLDMSSDCYAPGDQYYQLARAVKASGGVVVSDPDVTPFATHKGRFHDVLAWNGIRVPKTITVSRPDLDSFRLTPQALAQVGTPFVVKPGWGYGNCGVILDGTSEADLLRSADAAPDSDCFLIQERLRPRTLGGHTAWFRVFYVFGEVISCWWEPPDNVYSLVTPAERQTFGLESLETASRAIAALAKLPFFSTEFAIPEGQSLPVAVDYVNDECDMHVKSYYPTGVPDVVARRIAWLLASNCARIAGKSPLEHDLTVRDAIWRPPALARPA
jgi:hypothetical protein